MQAKKKQWEIVSGLVDEMNEGGAKKTAAINKLISADELSTSLKANKVPSPVALVSLSLK